MEGTQIPTKSPSFFCPVNQRETEKRNEMNAARRMVVLTFWSVVIVNGSFDDELDGSNPDVRGL
jgi:hypothetical protein